MFALNGIRTSILTVIQTYHTHCMGCWDYRLTWILVPPSRPTSEVREHNENITLRRACYRFIGAFAKLRKANISFDMSVRLSICPHRQLGSHWTDFHEI